MMLDDEMSELLGEIATAAFTKKENPTISDGLRYALTEQFRVSARAPHKSLWIEYNLRSAQIRSQALLQREFDPDETALREGWLIEQHPGIETAFQMHVFTSAEDLPDDAKLAGASIVDAFTFPLRYTWTVNDDPSPWRSAFGYKGALDSRTEHSDSFLATGIWNYNNDHVAIAESDALVPLDTPRLRGASVHLVGEWCGVLRRAWALLSTINDIPLISRDVVQSHGFVTKGRYRRFLDHTTLTLRVPGHNLHKLARQLVALARRRAHEVRGHWREDWRQRPSPQCATLLKHGHHAWTAGNRCQTCGGHRLWIREHQRGDASLGFVTHDYKVKREKEDLPKA